MIEEPERFSLLVPFSDNVPRVKPCLSVCEMYLYNLDSIGCFKELDSTETSLGVRGIGNMDLIKSILSDLDRLID